MTHTEYNKIVREVRGYHLKWKKHLGLSTWDARIDYFQDKKDGHPRTAMDCIPDWRYKHYMINVYIPALADEEPRMREYTMVHELCHVLVNQLREYTGNWQNSDLNHEERVVTEMAWAYYHTFNYGREAGRKEKP